MYGSVTQITDSQHIWVSSSKQMRFSYLYKCNAVISILLSSILTAFLAFVPLSGIFHFVPHPKIDSLTEWAFRRAAHSLQLSVVVWAAMFSSGSQCPSMPLTQLFVPPNTIFLFFHLISSTKSITSFFMLDKHLCVSFLQYLFIWNLFKRSILCHWEGQYLAG